MVWGAKHGNPLLADPAEDQATSHSHLCRASVHFQQGGRRLNFRVAGLRTTDAALIPSRGCLSGYVPLKTHGTASAREKRGRRDWRACPDSSCKRRWACCRNCRRRRPASPREASVPTGSSLACMLLCAVLTGNLRFLPSLHQLNARYPQLSAAADSEWAESRRRSQRSPST